MSKVLVSDSQPHLSFIDSNNQTQLHNCVRIGKCLQHFEPSSVLDASFLHQSSSVCVLAISQRWSSALVVLVDRRCIRYQVMELSLRQYAVLVPVDWATHGLPTVGHWFTVGVLAKTTSLPSDTQAGWYRGQSSDPCAAADCAASCTDAEAD